MYRVMLLDDEKNILSALRRTLVRHVDWELEVFVDGAEALRRAEIVNFELIVSDFRMPGMDGVQFLQQVKLLQPEAVRVILSGYTDLAALLGAINDAEIFRFISKPWNDYDLVATLKQALVHREVLVENRRLADLVRAQREELVRREQALRRLEAEHPKLVEVDWGPDGSIRLDDNV